MKRRIVLLLMILIGLFTFTGCVKEEKIKLSQDVDYSIIGEFTGKYLDIKQRGYYVDTKNEPNAPYQYIICMGEKNTGGYSLKIKEVNKIGKKVEVIVEEIEPGKDQVVTEAFTYPTLIIEFPEYQEKITIKNTKGLEFKELKN